MHFASYYASANAHDFGNDRCVIASTTAQMIDAVARASG
jgi:hypothetical protein